MTAITKFFDGFARGVRTCESFKDTAIGQDFLGTPDPTLWEKAMAFGAVMGVAVPGMAVLSVSYYMAVLGGYGHDRILAGMIGTLRSTCGDVAAILNHH